MISSDIWFPAETRLFSGISFKIKNSSRFFDCFSLCSIFPIWNIQKEIGGIFRRDAELNAPLLRHKMKGKSRMMNKIQAKEFYEKIFANCPEVLTVEDATKLLGFKSQTSVIRRIHQHKIRCLKVGRSFMIPKKHLIEYLLED